MNNPVIIFNAVEGDVCVGIDSIIAVAESNQQASAPDGTVKKVQCQVIVGGYPDKTVNSLESFDSVITKIADRRGLTELIILREIDDAEDVTLDE